MKTETTTTIIFTLPSGLELRLTNASLCDIEYLKGIETAVIAERKASAVAIESLRQRVKELEETLANSVSAEWHNEKVAEIESELAALKAENQSIKQSNWLPPCG
jgi:hypothetical protein